MTAHSSTNTVRIYTTQTCPYCHAAKDLLNQLKAEFNEVRVDGKPDLRKKMEHESGQRTVPQIWIGERHVGGCTELYGLHNSGKLQVLLKA